MCVLGGERQPSPVHHDVAALSISKSLPNPGGNRTTRVAPFWSRQDHVRLSCITEWARVASLNRVPGPSLRMRLTHYETPVRRGVSFQGHARSRVYTRTPPAC